MIIIIIIIINIIIIIIIDLFKKKKILFCFIFEVWCVTVMMKSRCSTFKAPVEPLLARPVNTVC